MRRTGLFFHSPAGRRAAAILLLLTFVGMAGFVRHSVHLGLGGLLHDLSGRSPFYAPGAPVLNLIMFVHMLTGAALSVLAPLQLVDPIRRRWPGYHRWSGRVTVGLGLFTAFGGVTYALTRGAIGGPFMNAASTLYGTLMLIAAVVTYQTARQREWARHRRWGWRLTVLVMASWLYRMHYVIWDRIADGYGTTPDGTGPFDRFQAWAFYLSYLVMLEILLFRERSAPRPKAPVPPKSLRLTAPLRRMIR